MRSLSKRFFICSKQTGEVYHSKHFYRSGVGYLNELNAKSAIKAVFQFNKPEVIMADFNIKRRHEKNLKTTFYNLFTVKPKFVFI